MPSCPLQAVCPVSVGTCFPTPSVYTQEPHLLCPCPVCQGGRCPSREDDAPLVEEFIRFGHYSKCVVCCQFTPFQRCSRVFLLSDAFSGQSGNVSQGPSCPFIFPLEMHVCYPYLKMKKAFKTLQSGCHHARPGSGARCHFPYSHHKNG